MGKYKLLSVLFLCQEYMWIYAQWGQKNQIRISISISKKVQVKFPKTFNNNVLNKRYRNISLNHKVKIFILLPKLFWPTVRKNCSSDREKLLKFETEFSKFLRSLEKFIQTVKWKNNFWNRMLFCLFLEISHKYLIHSNSLNWKQILGFNQG